MEPENEMQMCIPLPAKAIISGNLGSPCSPSILEARTASICGGVVAIIGLGVCRGVHVDLVGGAGSRGQLGGGGNLDG